jgi:NAD(P)H-dependent nitrite reductase small subunit
MEDYRNDGFFYVCKIDELKEGAGKRFLINETDIALFKVRGEIFAVSNVCPHQHSAIIYDGFIEDDYVVCPAHGWMFNLRTGKTATDCRGLDAYEVELDKEKVYVKVRKKRLSW